MNFVSKTAITAIVSFNLIGCGPDLTEIESPLLGDYPLSCDEVVATANLGMGIGQIDLDLNDLSLMLEDGLGFAVDMPLTVDCSFSQVTSDSFLGLWTAVNDACMGTDTGTVSSCEESADKITTEVAAYVNTILPDQAIGFETLKRNLESETSDDTLTYTVVDSIGDESASRSMKLSRDGEFNVTREASLILDNCQLTAKAETFSGDADPVGQGATIDVSQRFTYETGCIIPLSEELVFGVVGGYDIEWKLSGSNQ